MIKVSRDLKYFLLLLNSTNRPISEINQTQQNIIITNSADIKVKCIVDIICGRDRRVEGKVGVRGSLFHKARSDTVTNGSRISGNKPLRQPHPPEGRQQKQEELQSCSLWDKNHIHRKIDKMKRQRAMYHMREQDKTPGKQLNGDRQPSRKRIQNNDSEDDPGPWKKNGGKD